jgi:hypothetical protein
MRGEQRSSQAVEIADGRNYGEGQPVTKPFQRFVRSRIISVTYSSRSGSAVSRYRRCLCENRDWGNLKQESAGDVGLICG